VMRSLLLLGASTQRRSERHTKSGVAGGEHPTRWRFVWFMRFPLPQLLRGMVATTVVGGVCFLSVPNFQLQHAGFEEAFPFSGRSLWRWPPPQHKQRGDCL
jgi:hypothetical protein